VPYGTPGRLWLTALSSPGADLIAFLNRYGRPIRYRHVPVEWPLSAYQTIFATEAGSAEMPSRARPFSSRLATELVKRGVLLARLLLHTGVSAQEAPALPSPEPYRG